MSHSKHMLILNIPPELEEDLVDYLLAIDSLPGFTSYPARGHGEHSHLSIAEQVSGRRKRVQFEIVLDDENVEKLLLGLPEVGRGISYWLVPVTHMGRID